MEKIESLGAANFAFTFFQEYRKAMLKEEDRVTKVHQVWQKPSQGNIKINFDGSVRKAEKKGGIGIIARNEKGEVMGAVQATIDGVTDPEAIEAYAACRGMQFVQQMGFNNIVLEGDALSVILKILQPDPSLFVIGILIEEAKTMKKNFKNCKIQHVSREASFSG